MATAGYRDDDLGRRLLSIKSQLEQKKEARAQLEGERRTLQKQLFEGFDVKTLDEAEALVQKTERRVQKLGQEIRQELDEIAQALEE